MEQKINELGLDWKVDSCGTGSWHVGEKPDLRSINIAHKYGIDISNQRARQFKRSDLSEFDIILAMDTSNYNDIKKFTDEQTSSKVHMILHFQFPGENRVVPDPYFNGGFDHVYHILNSACDHFIKSIEVKN